MAEDQRRRVIVRGRVQGVAFRFATRSQASQLGVRGWVRNLADGSVEAAFEGSPEAVESALEFCQQGPPSAHVVRVDVFEEAPEGLSGFRIR